MARARALHRQFVGLLLIAAAAGGLAGCVVTPVPVRGPVVVAPRPVVVAPHHPRHHHGHYHRGGWRHR